MEQHLTTYEYGAMSSMYSVQAENKLTAYVCMCLHYDRNAFALVIYSPEDCKKDQWTSFDGKIADRLDEVFGGAGAFDKYVEANVPAIRAAFKTIKKVV